MKTFFNLFAVFLITVFLHGCNLLSAAGLSSQGQPVKQVDHDLASAPVSEGKIDHSTWNKLLQKHVDTNGCVDYQGFKKDEKALLSYLQMLADNEPSEGWSVQELLAYYINLYNAATVNLIVQKYPINSIKDIDGAWTKGRVAVGNSNLSLGGIENGILRKMNEPRIHFAINCASISCPKLMGEAYTAEKIDEQLDRAAREFINSDKNRITAKNPKVSSIFDWYAKDFKVNGKTDVIGYINKYSDTKIATDASLDYLEYNWDLNEQKE